MSKKILVTYATRTGWIVGVAEAIGRNIAENGTSVDVLPIQDVKNLSAYCSVVMGSAINGGEWLPEALQFVQTHRAELSKMPFAAFLVCMTLAMRNAEQYRSHVASWLAPVRALVQPVGEGLFAGGLEVRKIHSFSDRFKFSLSVLFGIWKEADHRDWDAIREWTMSVYPFLLNA